MVAAVLFWGGTLEFPEIIGGGNVAGRGEGVTAGAGTLSVVVVTVVTLIGAAVGGAS